MTPPRRLITPTVSAAEHEIALARIDELTRVIAGRSWADGPVAGLTLQQTMIVAAIAKRGRISREAMAAYLRNHDFAGDHDSTLRTQLMGARQRLAAHAISVTSLPGWGWEMDADSRTRWAAIAAPARDIDTITDNTDTPITGGRRAMAEGAP